MHFVVSAVSLFLFLTGSFAVLSSLSFTLSICASSCRQRVWLVCMYVIITDAHIRRIKGTMHPTLPFPLSLTSLGSAHPHRSIIRHFELGTLLTFNCLFGDRGSCCIVISHTNVFMHFLAQVELCLETEMNRHFSAVKKFVVIVSAQYRRCWGE